MLRLNHQLKQTRLHVSRTVRWLFNQKKLATEKHLLRYMLVGLATAFTFTFGHFYETYKQEKPELTASWVLHKVIQADEIVLAVAYAGTTLISLLVCMGLWMLRSAWNANKKIEKLGISIYSKPNSDTNLFLKISNENEIEYKVIGTIIEIAKHPIISPDLGVSGWDCLDKNSIRLLHDFGLPYTKHDIQLIKDIPKPDGNNGTKFSLIETPVDYLDASKILVIRVHKTDYYTIQRFQKYIKDKSIRFSLGSIQPEHHQIPHSLCLHYLVQLTDGHIICIRRKPNVNYAPDQISISGEEQLSSDDIEGIDSDSSMGHWFRRALCEEIFPLRATSTNEIEKNWQKISIHINALRVLSIFYEENFANFSIFGFARLNLNLDEYKSVFRELSRVSPTGRDKEGQLLCLTKIEAKNLIMTGVAKIKPVWGDDAEESIKDEQLHSSSRYRLLVFLQAVGELRD